MHVERGAVPSDAAAAGAVFPDEFTHWALIKLPQAREILYRTYENMRWRRVKLRELALDDPDAAFGELKMFEGDLGIQDKTAAMRL